MEFRIINFIYKQVFLFFCLFCLSGCSDIFLIFVKKDIKQKKVLPQINNFHIIKTENGIKIWELMAKYAHIEEDNNIINISTGSIKLYDKNTKYLASSDFLLAFLYIETNDIFFKGKNVIHTVENEKIITYDMKYIANENKIFSDKEIIIYKNNSIIKGNGFETTDGFKTVKIWQNIITER